MVRPNLSYEVLFAILLGIAAGLFFGPLCKVLKPVGDSFVIALQIIVLFYIPSLLMHGLGSLSPELAKKLFKRGWHILVCLWILVLVVCYIVKGVIPDPLPSPSTHFGLENVSSFLNVPGSTSTRSELYGLFNNIVPVVVLFSLGFGLSIMYLKEKEPLLSLLERVNSCLDKIIKWISFIAPIGIFAHVSYVVGSINFNDLGKLQLYIGLIIFITLFMSLWMLPILVSTLSSIPYKELLQEYKIVSLLPFATAIPTIALPYINNSMRRLAKRNNLELGTFINTSQTVIPIGFSVAQIGNFLPLLFIFFLSFFFRHPLTHLEMIFLPCLVTLFSIGLPQFSFVVLPFLLKTLALPSEGFNLYAEISAITLNFQVLLSSVSMLSFLYVVMLRYYGLLNIDWRRLVFHLIGMVVFLFAFVEIGKKYFHTVDNYHDLYYSLRIDRAVDSPPAVTVFKERTPPPAITIETPLARILHNKVIRVGYDPGGSSIPFCYLNKWGEVVGHDIAYAYQLAKDLDVKLELIPVIFDQLAEDIESGYFDIVMTAVLMSETRILKMGFSNAYTEQNAVLVVPTKDVDQYKVISSIREDPDFKIGAVGAYKNIVISHFSEEHLIPSDDLKNLLEGKVKAQMWSQLSAYIWCLAHPEFTTLPFYGAFGKKYFSYPVKIGSWPLISFVNEWLALKQEQGFASKQKEYWFLGKVKTSDAKRWSIISDVLHWVD